MIARMKRLDAVLIGLLAAVMSPVVPAQDVAPAPGHDTEQRAEINAAAAAPREQQPSAGQAALDCSQDGCNSDEGLVFKLRTRGERDPVEVEGASPMSPPALRENRRVDVRLDEPGKAVATGKFSVQLANGGVIWATEDPAIGLAELSVSAPTYVPFDGTAITKPVQFYVRSNYSAFVQRYELFIYRAADGDLIDPIATMPMEVKNTASTEWDGTLPSKYRFRTGDELVYVLRAYDGEGNFDETQPRKIQLVTPAEAERGGQKLRDSTEKYLGTALTVDQAQAQSLIDDAFAENGLRQQNIPLYGSRIRVQGRNLPEGYSLKINGETYPVDLDRKFVAEYLVPIGQYDFDVELQGGARKQSDTADTGSAPEASSERADSHYTLHVDVTGKYFFGVALADITIAQNNVNGSVDPLRVDSQYEQDVISDGRLAFYGKAKFKGKYLVTAQADTTEQALGHLFDGFTNADEPQDVFRRLDPDLYYPTYGDDSTTYRDVDTMGRFYLRVDWDKNTAMWGNFFTGFTGTEYGQYVRSLYGAALSWRSRTTNAWGDPGTVVRAFGSEAQTAPGHSEFIGTGGSLYYLKHQDILPGSDVIVLEIRDPTTGRVENRVSLDRGTDYEIDEMQGRILLTRPLAQITRENIHTLTRDVPLEGYEQRLLVDYEWVPRIFDSGNITGGFRGKHWFGDHLGVGLTYVDENRAGEDYNLAGGDVTLQAGKGTYLKAEYTQTESFGAQAFFSDNGGFTFTRLDPVGRPREGAAKAVEARANFRELGWTEQDWSAGAWWREIEAGYASSRYETAEDVTEYGAEVLGQFTPNIGMYARASKAERGRESLTQLQLTGEWRISDTSTLGAELRRVGEHHITGDGDGTLGALRYTHRFGTSLDVHGTAQVTLDDDGGKYADNNALTLGARYLFANQSTFGGEFTTGDRGNAATVEGEYKVGPDYSLYGSYTYSTDTTEYDPLFNPDRQNGWTLGQRWRLSNQVNLFNESQYLKSPNESGLAHTFGMDFYPAQGWNTGFTLQNGELVNSAGSKVDRRAVSINGGRTSPDTDWQSKLEWRDDSGAERRTQWVTTNRLVHKFNESWRIAARLNYSDTKDEIVPMAGAKFVEGNFGFAWRPWNSTRWGLFGRYTYLYDLSTIEQINGVDYDQRSQVLSLEGVYKHDQHWEFAGKLARRDGEVRFGRGAGSWEDSATNFASTQIRYELQQQWHALAEYRYLDVKDGGNRSGFLVGLDRDIGRNFRIGIGYNFTDFSDDLTNFDYDHKGFFLNLVGSY